MANNKNDNADEKTPNTVPKAELLDVPLIKAIFVSACVYFITYSIFSLLFGNAFGGFVATPLTTIAFYITSRWDRLRDSKEISFQSVLDLIKSVKISFTVILISVCLTFIVQNIFSALTTIALLTMSHDCLNCNSDSFTDFFRENLETSNYFIILLISCSYFSYLFCGFLTAKLAIK